MLVALLFRLDHGRVMHLLFEALALGLALHGPLGITELQQLVMQKRQVAADHRMIERAGSAGTAIRIGVRLEVTLQTHINNF